MCVRGICWRPDRSRGKSFNSSLLGRIHSKRARLFEPRGFSRPFSWRRPHWPESSFRGGPNVSFESRRQESLSVRPFPLPIAVIICSMLEHMMLMFALFQFEAAVPQSFSAHLPHPPPPPSQCKLKHQVFLKRFPCFFQSISHIEIKERVLFIDLEVTKLLKEIYKWK